MNIQQAFGWALKLKRTEVGFNQEELAHAAGKARSFVSAVERGTTAASITSVWELASALGTCPSELWLMAEKLHENTPAGRR